MRSWRRWSAVTAAGALAAACVPHSPVTSPAASDHTWQVVGHRMPGVSALDEAGAARWHGHFVHLQGRRAANANATCTAPAYVESTHPAEAFLAVVPHPALDARRC